MTAGRAAGDRESLRFSGRMTGLEALMWRLGRRDARFQATMSLVVTVDGRISLPDLASRLAVLCRSVPRLCDRVCESPLGLAAPSWEPDPDFAVDRHVAVATGELWEVASSVVADPFDDRRPPWRVAVVPGAGGAGDSVVLHLHHSYTDGLGGIRLLGELFDLDRGAESNTARHSLAADGGPSPAGDTPPAAPAAGGLEALLIDVEEEVRRALGLWSRALPWASRTLTAARRDPGTLLRSAADIAGAIQAQAGAAMGPASPVLARRSARVALVPLLVDLEQGRELSRRIGVTLNDVYLAGLLDGLERYHAKLGSVPPSLRLGIPISIRESEIDMRNQVFGSVLRGPLGSLDFAERARLVHEIVLLARRQPLAHLVEDIASAAIRLPGGVQAAASALSSLDVLASNVIGPPMPMWLTGRRIRAMVPFGPRSGSAINATLLSYDGTAHIGVNLDPAAVPDAGVLVDCLEAAFSDALTA